MTSTTKACLVLFLYSLTILSVATAQGRSPHGLANEYPMTLSPSAYEFFHPTTQKPDGSSPCGGESSCSPMPLAAQVEAIDQAQAQSRERSEMLTYHKGSSAGLGAAGVAGIVFGLAFAVLLAMGAYYVVATRRQNFDRAKAVQPEA